MKKIKIIALFVILTTAIGAIGQEVSFGLKTKWHRSKVYLKPAKNGFVYSCFKYYSVMSAGFAKIALEENEQISFSFKVKGKGELKPDVAGFRFGIYGKTASGKTAGYTLSCGVEEKGVSMSQKTPKAPGLLSGKGFKGIRSAGSGSINSAEFTEFKLAVTNLGKGEIEFKLFIDSLLTIKCKRASMPVASFDCIAFGTGGKVNSFIISDVKVAKGK
jgi:hypothetical protein